MDFSANGFVSKYPRIEPLRRENFWNLSSNPGRTSADLPRLSAVPSAPRLTGPRAAAEWRRAFVASEARLGPRNYPA
jgi:hypothetical protein